MTDVPTLRQSWAECRAAGMTCKQAADARGLTISAASKAASMGSWTWAVDYTANAERMRKLNADPEFAAANAERMRKLNADPEFAAANAERMRKRHADPEFAAANAERMRKLHADPDRNPLVCLTAAERADYDLLRQRGGLSRDDALRSIGREELIKPPKGT